MKSKLGLMVTSLLSVGVAFAADPATVLSTSTTAAAIQEPPSNLPSLGILVVFVLIFYFLAIRPQMKRSKEQREVVSNLEKGDEVVTSGGLYGKVVNVDSTIIELEVADKTVIKIQKQAVLSLVPKGTIGSGAV